MDRLRLERLSAGLLEWAVMLLPLLVYLLYLAMVVNRQRRPVVVTGAADQILLLVGVSGFLVVGPFTWPLHFLRGLSDYVYWGGYVAYLLVILGVALGSIRRQRACYVGTADGQLHAIDPLRGQGIWIAMIGQPVRGTPTVVPGDRPGEARILVGCEDGRLYCFRAE